MDDSSEYKSQGFQHFQASARHNQTVLQQIQTVMNEETQLLPDNVLRDFVQNSFRKGRQFIHAVGSHLTPCYLFEPGVVISRARSFRRAFQKHLPDTGFYFAMKSNNFPDVSRTVLNCGFGLDVSSGAELQIALELGADDIVFSGPGKTVQELDLAIENSDRVVVLMDSFSEMKRLEKRAARQGRKIRTGIRLTTEPHGLWRKFGILPDELHQFIGESKRHSHIELQGIQFHSSWNMGPERQVSFIKELGALLSDLSHEDLDNIMFIDIGGGYWPEQGEWLQPAGTSRGAILSALGVSGIASPDSISESSCRHYFNPSASIEMFADELSATICEHIHSHVPCRICFEPGRWVCNESMYIILKVMDKKYDDLVIADGGTNAIGWERFETDYCPILNISRPAMTERECLIMGSLCTPHDVWGYSYWGRDIQEGDLLMIPGQGAYTYSLRQHFIKAVPEVISFP